MFYKSEVEGESCRMNEEYVEMNECEKKNLIDKSKERLRKEFAYISIDDWKKYNQFIKDKEVLNALIILLDAKLEERQIQCNYSNEYIDSDNTHRFFIHGAEKINLNYDNVLAIIPNKKFTYLYEDEDITESFVSSMDMIDVDSYSGKFIYAGILNEESADAGFADLNSTTLINETKIYNIDENSAMWKRYFAESYRLYEAEQYKLAFLHAFIGFESLIEHMNSILYHVYLDEQNQTLEFVFEKYNRSYWTPLSLLENDILKSQSYQRLKHLENENRRLIDDKLKTILRYVNDLESKPANNKLVIFKFYEKLRNILAHGDSLQREDLKDHYLYKKYCCDEENSLEFDIIYRDFFEQIGILIAELVKP